MEPSPGDITLLLDRLAKGDQDVQSQLAPLIYKELHKLAISYMRKERPDHTLQATALVHEAYLKLVKQRDRCWQNRSHFFGLAAQFMRRILTDHARAHLRGKRGGEFQKVSLDDEMAVIAEQSRETLAVHEALVLLEKLDPRQGKIVELRYFCGFTAAEIAQMLDISLKTVQREWDSARAWLHLQLKSEA